jgi:hypothetical protein
VLVVLGALSLFVLAARPPRPAAAPGAQA